MVRLSFDGIHRDHVFIYRLPSTWINQKFDSYWNCPYPVHPLEPYHIPDIYGRVITVEYDPNRNAYICLIHYGDGEKRYILHPIGTIIGDTIISSTEVPINTF